MMERLPNIHPGEVLREEFLIPFGLSQYRLAKAIGVPEARISAICAGKRAITADTALRLSRFFGTSAGFWLGLQADYDRKKPCARQATPCPASSVSGQNPLTLEPVAQIRAASGIRGARDHGISRIPFHFLLAIRWLYPCLLERFVRPCCLVAGRNSSRTTWRTASSIDCWWI
jgi:antitoxin HigA-1